MAGTKEAQEALAPLFRGLCHWNAQPDPPKPEDLLQDLVMRCEGLLALGYLPLSGGCHRGRGVGRRGRALLGAANRGASGYPTARLDGPWRIEPLVGERHLRGHLILRTQNRRQLTSEGWDEVAGGIGNLIERSLTQQGSRDLLALGARSASLAHDLRNRLTGMMLASNRARVDGAAADLEGLENQLMDAAEMCGRALDGSGAGWGSSLGACPQVQSLNLEEVLQTALHRAHSVSRPGSAPLPSELQPPRASMPRATNVIAQRSLLEDALVNLITNGAEAAGPRGTVQIGLQHEAGLVGAWVQDTGPGLSPEATRAGVSNGGTGHGLSSAVECADRHGGSLTCARQKGLTLMGLNLLDARHLEGPWEVHFDPIPSRMQRGICSPVGMPLHTTRIACVGRWMEILAPHNPGRIHAWRGTQGLHELSQWIHSWGSNRVQLEVHSVRD